MVRSKFGRYVFKILKRAISLLNWFNKNIAVLYLSRSDDVCFYIENQGFTFIDYFTVHFILICPPF